MKKGLLRYAKIMDFILRSPGCCYRVLSRDDIVTAGCSVTDVGKSTRGSPVRLLVVVIRQQKVVIETGQWP